MNEHDFILGETVWYMNGLWAKFGKITKIRTISSIDSILVDYEINGEWIPMPYVFPNKEHLKQTLMHHIEYNSQKI